MNPMPWDRVSIPSPGYYKTCFEGYKSWDLPVESIQKALMESLSTVEGKTLVEQGPKRLRAADVPYEPSKRYKPREEYVKAIAEQWPAEDDIDEDEEAIFITPDDSMVCETCSVILDLNDEDLHEVFPAPKEVLKCDVCDISIIGPNDDLTVKPVAAFG
jgi:hypothetical protein